MYYEWTYGQSTYLERSALKNSQDYAHFIILPILRFIIHFISYDKNTESSIAFLEFCYLRKNDRYRSPFHVFLGHKQTKYSSTF